MICLQTGFSAAIWNIYTVYTFSTQWLLFDTMDTFLNILLFLRTSVYMVLWIYYFYYGYTTLSRCLSSNVLITPLGKQMKSFTSIFPCFDYR